MLLFLENLHDHFRYKELIGKQKNMATMQDQELLQRIVLDPKIMVGKPIIRGTRLTVEFIIGLMAHGASETEIIQEYTDLAPQDIQACLLFASRTLSGYSYMPLTV